MSVRGLVERRTALPMLSRRRRRVLGGTAAAASLEHDFLIRTLHFDFTQGFEKKPFRGPSRWTNLYFPSSWTFRGDFIGGPLREVFGEGIRDVPVTTRQWNGFLSHTLY